MKFFNRSFSSLPIRYTLDKGLIMFTKASVRIDMTLAQQFPKSFK